MPKTAKFITLEGSEGAGKSTNLAFIADWLRSRECEVLTTREPGGTPIGEAIRGILLDTQFTEMTPETELLLMFAARNQHIQQKIQPALKSGKWVISDRFTDASYAYQGGARGLPFERIEPIEQWVQQGFQPDLVFVFDLPVEVGMQRVKQRGEATDRFEQEQAAFFERVRAAYLKRAEQHPERYCVLDASQPLERVQQAIAQRLNKLWEGN